MSGPVFGEGEKVLCWHGPLLYEAKVLKLDLRSDGYHCLVHYAGWSKSWDEYIKEGRVLKHNEKNLKLQKEKKEELENQKKSARNRKSVGVKVKGGKKSDVVKALNEKPATPKVEAGSKPSKNQSVGDADVSKPNSTGKNSAKGSAEPSKPTVEAEGKPKDKPKDKPSKTKDKPNSSSSANGSSLPTTEEKDKPVVPRKKKKFPDSSVALPAELKKLEAIIRESIPPTTFKLGLPEKLMTVLADDWDYITRQKKLAILPARVTIDKIFDDYMEYSKQSEDCVALCSGLRTQFNWTLGTMLLYLFERPQYRDILKSKRSDRKKDKVVDLSRIYGLPHLLRCLYKMEELITGSVYDEGESKIVIECMQSFIGFLEEKVDQYFVFDDYGIATAEYHRNAPV